VATNDFREPASAQAARSLDADTRLDGAGGRYTATLSPAWRIWGPSGGYLAAIALRAAGREAALPRPASFSCQFLGVAAFAPAEVRVEALRRGRAAELFRVTLHQAGRQFLEAQVWTTAAKDGLEHDFAPPPAVLAPEQLDDVETLLRDVTRSRHAFWQNLERRPVDWQPPDARTVRAPIGRNWLRFRPEARFDDPFLDAARPLILIDTLGFPALTQHHLDLTGWTAPSLDVAVQFHRPASGSAWLLAEACADVAQAGLASHRVRVWSRDGALVASGGGQLLFRRVGPGA